MCSAVALERNDPGHPIFVPSRATVPTLAMPAAAQRRSESAQPRRGPLRGAGGSGRSWCGRESGWRRLPGTPHRRDMLARSGGRSVPPGSRRREGGRPSSKARVRPHPSRRCGSRRRRRRDPSRPRRRGRTRPGGPPATSRGATGAARRAGHARQQGSCRPWPIFIGDPHRAGDFTRASPGSLQIDAGRFVQQARALLFSISIHTSS